MIELFQRVVLTRDLPDVDLRRGEVATVVELHTDSAGNTVGCELEMFSPTGKTLAVASVPIDAVTEV